MKQRSALWGGKKKSEGERKKYHDFVVIGLDKPSIILPLLLIIDSQTVQFCKNKWKPSKIESGYTRKQKPYTQVSQTNKESCKSTSIKEQISKIRDKESLAEPQPRNLLGRTTEEKSPPKLARVKDSVFLMRGRGRDWKRKTTQKPPRQQKYLHFYKAVTKNKNYKYKCV